MDRKTFKVVKLVWLDATSIDAWSEVDEAVEYDPHVIVTCGFLLGETDSSYIVSANLDLKSDDVSCCMIVPKASLIKPAKVIYRGEETAS